MGDLIDQRIEQHRRDPDPHPRLRATIQAGIDALAERVEAIEGESGHALALGSANPTNVADGAASHAGSATTAAREDHRHELTLPDALRYLANLSGTGTVQRDDDGTIQVTENPRVTGTTDTGNLRVAGQSGSGERLVLADNLGQQRAEAKVHWIVDDQDRLEMGPLADLRMIDHAGSTQRMVSAELDGTHTPVPEVQWDPSADRLIVLGKIGGGPSYDDAKAEDRDFVLVGPGSTMRCWRYTTDPNKHPGLELIWGTDTPSDSANNRYADIYLDQNGVVHIRRRDGGTQPMLHVDPTNGLKVDHQAGTGQRMVSAIADGSQRAVPEVTWSGSTFAVAGACAIAAALTALTGVFGVDPGGSETVRVGGAVSASGQVTGSTLRATSGYAYLSGPAGTFRGIRLQTDNVDRWRFVCATAEGGADSGSDAYLYAYNDSGVNLGYVIGIQRQAGGAITLTRPLISTSITMSGALSAGSRNNYLGVSTIPLCIGQSGINYPSIAYNVDYQTTNGVWNSRITDKSVKLALGGSSTTAMVLSYAASTAAGSPITFSDLLTVTSTGITMSGALTGATTIVVGTDPGGSGTLRVGGIVKVGGYISLSPSSGLAAIGTSGSSVAVFCGAGNETRLLVNQDGSIVVGTDPGGSETLRVGGDARINGRIILGGYALAEKTGFGYSPSAYPVQMLASTSALTLAIGVDPSTVAGGAFTGDGSEIIIRRNTTFRQKNAGGTDWEKATIYLGSANFTGKITAAVPVPATFSSYADIQAYLASILN